MGSEKVMRWITRSHAQVDRIACPWLIRKFVDSEAEFIFVASSMVSEMAEKLDAIPVSYTHLTLPTILRV